MKPRPEYQRRQAHRQRRALGRALHQVRAMRDSFGRGRRRLPQLANPLHIPRTVRKHAKLLRHVWFVFGS